MTGSTVNGSGNGMRSGAQTLTLLAAPLNAAILRALADGTRQVTELRQATGSPAQTTLRAQLKRLTEIGAVEKQRSNRFPGVLEYELTPAGRELLLVDDVLERWLGGAPQGPVLVRAGQAKAAVKAFTDGWSSTMLRALAVRPLSLTELDGIIGSLSYPSLERRLNAMRLVGQVEARHGNGRGTPYAVSEWLRRGAGPLAAAARWEQRHRPLASPQLNHIDVETLFLLAVPLIELPDGLAGPCQLTADGAKGGDARLAGVSVAAETGTVASCTTRLPDRPDAWARGAPCAWLNAIVALDPGKLERGGDCGLANALIEAIHRSLFEKEVAQRS